MRHRENLSGGGDQQRYVGDIIRLSESIFMLSLQPVIIMGNRNPVGVPIPKSNDVASVASDSTQSEDESRPDNKTSMMLLQPESNPITQEQLVNEVKGIYAGLIMVEKKCVEACCTVPVLRTIY
jgi:hypothetical protein